MTDPVKNLERIATEMADAGLPQWFIAECSSLARCSEAICELMDMWLEAESGEDRDATVATLYEMIEDHENAPATPVEEPRIGFDELDGIAAQVVEHKKRIRAIIDQHGGVSEVARLSGIPQPALSQMLSTASMPRRKTLNRIANALNIPESALAGEWMW